MWYKEPEWWGLIFSIIAIGISSYTLQHRKKLFKSDVQRDLTNQAININRGLVELKVKGPYANNLNIKDEEIDKFQTYAAILFNHINLLHSVYNHREILGDDIKKFYENWANLNLKPWIENEKHLKGAWRGLRSTKDLVGKDFVEWLEKLWPIA